MIKDSNNFLVDYYVCTYCMGSIYSLISLLVDFLTMHYLAVSYQLSLLLPFSVVLLHIRCCIPNYCFLKLSSDTVFLFSPPTTFGYKKVVKESIRNDHTCYTYNSLNMVRKTGTDSQNRRVELSQNIGEARKTEGPDFPSANTSTQYCTDTF